MSCVIGYFHVKVEAGLSETTESNQDTECPTCSGYAPFVLVGVTCHSCIEYPYSEVKHVLVHSDCKPDCRGKLVTTCHHCPRTVCSTCGQLALVEADAALATEAALVEECRPVVLLPDAFSSPSSSYIKVFVADTTKTCFHLRMKTSMKLRSVFDLYLQTEHSDSELSRLRAVVNGIQVFAHQTPAEIGLVEGDVIVFAVLEVGGVWVTEV